MVRKSRRRRYRKAKDMKSPGFMSSLYDTGQLDMFACAPNASDDRKTYASKVKSLIEKKHRSVNNRFKKSNVLREILASYPKNIKSFEEELTYQRNDSDIDYDPDLEEVYESQKLNFRRMISNLSKHIYEDSDFDSWSDLESNFSLIYEPLAYGSRRSYHLQSDLEDVDDITLTLEKVKNLKNASRRGTSLTSTPSPTALSNSQKWDPCSSFCDSWSYCTCSNASEVSSYLSTCSCCRTMKHVGESRFCTNNNITYGSTGKKDRRNHSGLARHDSWSNSEFSQTYEPVSADRMMWTSRIKQLKRKLRASSLQKNVDENWDSWSQYSNLASVPLPISSKEKKMQELAGKLKEDPESDWETHSEKELKKDDLNSSDWDLTDSVNLGLIYIPMDAPKKAASASSVSSVAKSVSEISSTFLAQSSGFSRKSLDSLHNLPVCPEENEEDLEDTISGKSDDVDPFGSLESLIFEPKESFPDAIGRNNKLKASISISNISNRSISDASEATVTDGCPDDDDLAPDDLTPDDLAPQESTGADNGPSGSPYCLARESPNNVGSYWDWGRTDKTATGGAPVSPSTAQTAPPEPHPEKDIYTDSSFVSEHQRSSLTSECKTCAGTSVASWTYIGLGKVVSKTNNACNGGGRGGASRANGGVATLAQQKREVTWKIISEQNNKDVFELTGCPATGHGTDGRGMAHVNLVGGGQVIQNGGQTVFEVYNSWSDLESLIFADADRASTLTNSMRELILGESATVAAAHPGNRMSSYRDDWLFWDQQRKQRKMDLPNRELTWRNKAKRMLLWMHYSQGQGGPPMEQWSWWKAKQRGSILWLICKANNNKVPDDLKDPYYRDHDDQDQLKPLVVHALASAEYYCLALGNIYADPNYHNLNHWGVIQALARKGVYVAEPSDVALTETVLIQTSPIRMSAHMAVIEAIMALYLKETITVERIVNAVRRFVPPGGPIELPTDIEEALLFWINKVCVKMKHRIEDDMNIGTPEVQKDVADEKKDGKNESKIKDVESETATSDKSDKSGNIHDKVAPPIPLLQDLGDLSDGCCLASLISYYCPSVFRWQEICLNDPMSMADSLYNLQLVQKFCRDHLPYDPCFLTLEDMVYQHSSVRQNILVFLAELFFLFEVRPAKCVKMFGQRPEVLTPEAAGAVRRNGCGLVSSATKRSFQHPVSPIPDLRSNFNSTYNSSPDVNRISPKSSMPTFRESLLPRRQSSQHERMQERSKRFSFTDGSRGGPLSPSNSMRRTHSMQDIDKNGAEKPYADTMHSENYRNADEEGSYPGAPISQGYFPQRISRSAGREDDRVIYDDTSELYLRPLNASGSEGEPLMPAITKPAKEKSYNDSKPEEMGEYQRQNANHRSRGIYNKRSSPPKEEKSDRLPSPQRYIKEVQKSSPKSDYNDSRKNEDGFYLNNKREIPYDYPDNQELEEHLTNNMHSKQEARILEGKQPFILTSDDCLRLKEGSGESVVYIDQDLRLKKGAAAGTTSFAQLSKLRENQIGGINIVYMQHDDGQDGNRHPALKSSFLQKGRSEKGDRKTSFAALPNQTTWQQHQGRQQGSQLDPSGHESPSNGTAPEAPLASQLCDVRLKLEEKRRRIETEKRKMEVVMGKTREKVGKAAFLQAVGKGRTSGRGTPESGAGDEIANVGRNGASTGFSDGGGDARGSASPEVEGGNYEEYNRSIEQLNTNLSDLQSDIQRLTLQQEQIQQLMINGIQQQAPEPQNQFYLHDNAAPQQVGNWNPPQRSPPREMVYQPLQRSPSREQLFPSMQRSQSIEQLYQPQPLRRTASREQLYQAPLQRTVSREQLYQPQLQRTASREQLYQPQLQRTASREQLYQPQLQRTASREQLYQPQLQRTASREQLYQPQQLLHISPGMPQPQWGHPMGISEVSHRPVGAIIPQQHAYVDQSGYILHQQPPPGVAYPMGPQYIPMNMPMYHNGSAASDPYAQYGQYSPHIGELQQMQSPYRLHIEVPGAMPVSHVHPMMQGPSSRSQSPMMHYQQQPPSRPPSRPPSASALPGMGPPVSLPAKAVPISAPPESFMEPQLVHFIDVPGEGDQHAPETTPYDEHLARETSRALASLDQAISGTATYRVTSPTRPVLGKTFRVPKPKLVSPPPPRDGFSDSIMDDPSSPTETPEYLGRGASEAGEKGFFVSFDGEQPKRPKPPLRAKKGPKTSSKSEAGTPETENAPEIMERRLSFDHSIPKVSPPRTQLRPISLFDNSSPDTRASPVEPELVFDDTDNLDVTLESVERIKSPLKAETSGVGFIIGTELVKPDPTTEDEMAKKKEKILMSVIKRREQQESLRAKKELDAAKRREQDRMKQEMLERKKEEDRARRRAILEQYMQRKAAMEEQEGELRPESVKTATLPKLKGKPMKPRPKSLHESALSAAEHRAADRMNAASGIRGSQTHLAGKYLQKNNNFQRKQDQGGAGEPGSYASNYRYADTDSGLGRSTPPRRAPSPGQHAGTNRHLPSPSYVSPPGSLPPGLVSRRMGGLFSDTASDSCSTNSSTVEYTGPKLFKQPTAKSNRGIISNAINTVLAGAVNGDMKRRILEEINRSDSKHFLILFRDAGCQFRALYSYSPEKDEVFKLHGTGPKQITEKMIDKFFKYNCGGRNFTEIQTKHLTVTIDAFTIQNSLWQGKRVLPSKKEYF